MATLRDHKILISIISNTINQREFTFYQLIIRHQIINEYCIVTKFLPCQKLSCFIDWEVFPGSLYSFTLAGNHHLIKSTETIY